MTLTRWLSFRSETVPTPPINWGGIGWILECSLLKSRMLHAGQNNKAADPAECKRWQMGTHLW